MTNELNTNGFLQQQLFLIVSKAKQLIYSVTTKKEKIWSEEPIFLLLLEISKIN